MPQAAMPADHEWAATTEYLYSYSKIKVVEGTHVLRMEKKIIISHIGAEYASGVRIAILSLMV